MNKILLSLAAALAICFTACAQKKEKQSMDNEIVGEVVAVGKDVTKFKVGDYAGGG